MYLFVCLSIYQSIYLSIYLRLASHLVQDNLKDILLSAWHLAAFTSEVEWKFFKRCFLKIGYMIVHFCFFLGCYIYIYTLTYLNQFSISNQVISRRFTQSFKKHRNQPWTRKATSGFFAIFRWSAQATKTDTRRSSTSLNRHVWFLRLLDMSKSHDLNIFYFPIYWE